MGGDPGCLGWPGGGLGVPTRHSHSLNCSQPKLEVPRLPNNNLACCILIKPKLQESHCLSRPSLSAVFSNQMLTRRRHSHICWSPLSYLLIPRQISSKSVAWLMCRPFWPSLEVGFKGEDFEGSGKKTGCRLARGETSQELRMLSSVRSQRLS